MKKRKQSVQIGLGATSIFMIFVILCMTILSVLSYTRASQNEKIAERERLFQEAIMRSEAAASELQDEIISNEFNSFEDITNFSSINELIENYNMEIAKNENECTLLIPILNTQYLKVSFEIEGNNINTTEWKTIVKGEDVDAGH